MRFEVIGEKSGETDRDCKVIGESFTRIRLNCAGIYGEAPPRPRSLRIEPKFSKISARFLAPGAISVETSGQSGVIALDSAGTKIRITRPAIRTTVTDGGIAFLADSRYPN
jgi:hypothetical protein